MGNPKKISDHVPILHDQGMPYLAAAGKPGVSVQSVTHTMGASGDVTFEGMGLQNMADGDYQIFIQNHTDVADEATVALNTRTALGFTIAGPDQNDVLDIMIVGTLANQVGEDG